MNKIQKEKPSRNCTKTYSTHNPFKPYLREDFNKRCGYCDDLDIYLGGSRGYQIDHFKPHSIKRFENLKATYSNLIYSCPFCNRSKWNKWKDTDGFIDPCLDEYDIHLERNNKGQIFHKTSQGEYIFKNLNLGLKRHELLWCLSKLEEQKLVVKKYITKFKGQKDKKLELFEAFLEIQDKVDEYTLFERNYE